MELLKFVLLLSAFGIFSLVVLVTFVAVVMVWLADVGSVMARPGREINQAYSGS